MVDKNYISTLIQSILDKEFLTSIERKVNFHDTRINFRCPYCHEGRTKSKKRGNLYFDKLLYVCFRCGKKTNLDKFAKDFNFRMDPSKKLELIEHLNSTISYKDAEDDFLDTEFDKLINMSDLERIFNSGEQVITDFKPIIKNSLVYQYLVGRGITENMHQNIYEGKYWINSDRYDPIIILLNRRGSKILGAQIRNLKDGKRRLFKIYNFETLYKWIHEIDEIEDISINQIVVYNKLSYYFNILNVDFSEKVTIFEGYLDSLFYPNSIGVVGVNTDMKFIESNNLELQYFFDNDSAGFDKSEQKLKQGYPVFLWKKLFQDIVDKKNSSDPYQLMYRISKVKDLNRLAELVPTPYSKLNLKEFFSKDVLDIRWIPKKEKKKYQNWKKKSA
jgi:DNA-directed RNA polymerase subunit RPC12/RpoP